MQGGTRLNSRKRIGEVLIVVGGLCVLYAGLYAVLYVWPEADIRLVSLAASVMLLLSTIGFTLYAYTHLGFAERVALVAFIISFSIWTTLYVIDIFLVDIRITVLHLGAIAFAPVLLYKFVEWRQTRTR